MTNKEIDNSKQQINPMAAAVAGVVVGLGAAVAGAVILNNEDVKTEVKKKITSGAESVEKAAEATKEAVKAE